MSADDGCCLSPCFFVWQVGTASSSQPDEIKAARTVAVKLAEGHRRSVLDRTVRAAFLEQVLGLASYGAVSNHLR